jgi:hypothetical protein
MMNLLYITPKISLSTKSVVFTNVMLITFNVCKITYGTQQLLYYALDFICKLVIGLFTIYRILTFTENS